MSRVFLVEMHYLEKNQFWDIMWFKEFFILFFVMEFLVEVRKQPVNKRKELLFVVYICLVGKPPIVRWVLNDEVAYRLKI